MLSNQAVNWLSNRREHNKLFFLGTLLASIGVPLLLNALTGKGLQADRTGTTNTMSVYVPGTKSKGR